MTYDQSPEIIELVRAHGFHAKRFNWEVPTLEDSTGKLLAATTISRDSFETALLDKPASLE